MRRIDSRAGAIWFLIRSKIPLPAPRSLNRRLEAEGTTFRRLLDQARFEVARQLLAGTRLQVTNIALTLGYTDTSSFSHAFQRWSGAAPSDWRARL